MHIEGQQATRCIPDDDDTRDMDIASRFSSTVQTVRLLQTRRTEYNLVRTIGVHSESIVCALTNTQYLHWMPP